MQNKDIKVKCYKCGNSFTTDMMRQNPMKPGQLICKHCLAKHEQPSEPVQGLKPNPNEPSVKYYCIKCKYNFTRRKSAVVNRCPYCGGENTLTTRADAATLIKDADREEFEP